MTEFSIIEWAMMAFVIMLGFLVLLGQLVVVFGGSRMGLRSKMVHYCVLVLGALGPVYDACLTGVNAKKIISVVNLIVAIVGVIAAVWDVVNSIMVWQVKSKLVSDDMENAGLKWVIPGGERSVWVVLTDREKARVVLSVISLGVSVYEVLFRFELIKNPSFILAKWFGNTSFTFGPIMVGLEALHLCYKDWAGKQIRICCLIEGIRKNNLDEVYKKFGEYDDMPPLEEIEVKDNGKSPKSHGKKKQANSPKNNKGKQGKKGKNIGQPSDSASVSASESGAEGFEAVAESIYAACISKANAEGPWAYLSSYTSITCFLRTSGGVVFSVNFLARSAGHEDDWSVEKVNVVLIPFALKVKRISAKLRRKIRALRKQLPYTPILLVGDSDVSSGGHLYWNMVEELAEQERVDLIMSCSFSSRDGGQRLTDSIALFSNCY